MGKNKLRKFAEMENLSMVFQYPYGVLRDKGFAMRGHWHEEFFGNGNPITVELGCGKGEYAVGLARRFPERNFIGIDIKGARMWTGAKSAAAEGYSVGLLDADIFGPSLPKMFGLESTELYMHEVDGRNLIIPAEAYGVKVLSIGFVIDPSSAAVWRGAMASNALRQLIEQADWGELDYFLIDMPPGTSDIHLTLVQTLALTGAVVVTTPQKVAIADARKGIAMFRDSKINVPVLGVVDNMAWFTPEKHPDERYYLFGDDANVDALAVEYDVPVLARIPLVANVGEHSDSGRPVATEATASAAAFMHLAHELIDAVDRRNSELPPTAKVEVR